MKVLSLGIDSRPRRSVPKAGSVCRRWLSIIPTLLGVCLSGFAFPQTYAADLTAGLVVHLPCDGNAQDVSGHHHHGLVTGATLTTDRFGQANQAFRFDGVSQYIELADTTDLHFDTGGFSLSVWAAFEDGGGERMIVAKHISGVVSGWFLEIHGDVPKFYLSGDPRGASDAPLAANTWHHLVAVYDGAVQRLYVDGVEKAAAPRTYDAVASTPICLGRNEADNYFQGSIDDVRIYQRPLSTAEVEALFGGETVAITTQPGPQLVALGDLATFNVIATGTAPLDYQWRRNGIPLEDGNQVQGARTATLTVANVQATEVGDYSVVISNAGGNVTSQSASLGAHFTPGKAAALQISVPSTPGGSYQLQASSDLTTWTHEGAPKVATESLTTWQVTTLSPTERFFRVQGPAGGGDCVPFAWNAASGERPDEVDAPMTLVNQSQPETPVLGDQQLLIQNDVQTEAMFYLHRGPELQIPNPLIIEAEMRFISGFSEKVGRAPAFIGFTVQPWVGAVLGFAQDTVFQSDTPDQVLTTASVDTDDTYHQYRVEVDTGSGAGAIRVYQDGQLLFTGQLQQGGYNVSDQPEIWFGEGSEWAWGGSSWRSFRHNAPLCGAGGGSLRCAVQRVASWCWLSEPGLYYQTQLQNPDAAGWTNVGLPRVGDGTTQCVFDAGLTSGGGPYRVVISR